ncbi:protein kinase 1 [Phthorimaea operculella granulovirus]|uniref:Protein kinase 1 n=1 Tax=Phthorimaea operculella granulovirus TaxID=192584 RepID=Q8JS56_9BBAC|nr:protein kinase 1 [Phthorimaea operculella granulovirus]AAM70201.1 protein kinase 1 [Phthorimaea operculella granulovirus]ANY57392.1 protein kinase 1 [Phthorimaea operculella granulovirus]QBH65838.1 protein kinase 1 [Phthorimaea operculella granulovirus]QBH65968.1 protein kinase 1 [Phthorimaea operculella granulovirus]QBH66098.1 protein kinase 1 [Phthorimaea operculella granulovirus]
MNPSRSIARVVQDLKNIQILEKLNKNEDSSYENVYLCKKRNDPTKYVCKLLEKRIFNPLEFAVAVMMKDNPHYVNIQNFVYTENGDVFYLMDYIKDGDLFDLIKRNKKKIPLDENACRRIIITLVNALNDLHKHYLIHNDIKLENLLYDRSKKRVYLCDFGLVSTIGAPSCYDGTVVYFSPEKIVKSVCDVSFDWWAVGVVAYEILSTHYPFDLNDNDGEEVNSIEPDEMLPLYTKPLPRINHVSNNANDFVQKMLCLDIDKRLSTYDEIIKHPWLLI